VITRVLGTDPEVDVDTFEVEARPGDVFMICSDGLTSMVDDEAILGVLGQPGRTLEQRAHGLVDAANRGGGEDNITVILFELGDGDPDDTGTFAAVEELPPPDDDERTLTELDAVPTVDDTVLVSRAEREALSADSPRRVPRTAIAVISGTIVVVLAALVVWTLSRSYFVGVQSDGHIAVYQGFPWNVVGGVRLYRVRYQSPVLAGQLSEAERRKLFDHDLRSYGRALDEVTQYEADIVP
jgi:protein phosphatase